jgi:hypothetical protein
MTLNEYHCLLGFDPDCNMFCQPTIVTQEAESLKRPKNLQDNSRMTL